MGFNPAGGAISGATDVALSNPANNQVLTYNSGVAKWQNQTAAAGGNVTIAQLPAGSVIHVLESGGSYTRPTSRTDVRVIFIGTTDPGSTALSDDLWFKRP